MNIVKQLLVTAVLCAIVSQTIQAKGPQGQMFKMDPSTFAQKWSYQTSNTKAGASNPTYSSIKSFTKKNVSFDLVPGMSIRVFKGPNGGTSKGTIDIPADAITELSDKTKAIGIFGNDPNVKFKVLPLMFIESFQKSTKVRIKNVGAKVLYVTSYIQDDLKDHKTSAIYGKELKIPSGQTKTLSVPKENNFSIQLNDSQNIFKRRFVFTPQDLTNLAQPLKFDSDGNASDDKDKKIQNP